MPHRCFMSRESQKLICVHAEDNVMKSCFYCKNCEKCNTFSEIISECKANGLLSFIREVKN